MRPHGWHACFHHSHAIIQTFSAKSSSIFYYVNLLAFVLCGMRLSLNLLMDFMLPKCAFVLLKINSYASLCFLKLLYIFLLRIFHKFLEPDMHFTLKIDSDIRDSCTSPIYSPASRLFLYMRGGLYRYMWFAFRPHAAATATTAATTGTAGLCSIHSSAWS